MSEILRENIEFTEIRQRNRQMIKVLVSYAEKMRELLKKQNMDTFVKRIGKTTYKVRVHFDNDSTESVKDKIMHLIEKELATAVAERSIYE